METEKMTFNIFGKDGKPAELIIREGKAPDMLPILPPVKYDITGTIGAPFEFLLRRIPVVTEWKNDSLDGGSVAIPQIDISRCHILVNRDLISIQLVLNEIDPNTRGVITGKLAAHPKFVEFGINTSKVWTPA